MLSSLLLSLAIATADRAEQPQILAVCAAPAAMEYRFTSYNPISLPYGESVTSNGNEIHLVMKEGQLDVVYSDALAGAWSARGEGAQVAIPMHSGRFIHLLVSYPGLSEQYVFQFNAHGEGELIWTAQSDEGQPPALSCSECRMVE